MIVSILDVVTNILMYFPWIILISAYLIYIIYCFLDKRLMDKSIEKLKNAKLKEYKFQNISLLSPVFFEGKELTCYPPYEHARRYLAYVSIGKKKEPIIFIEEGKLNQEITALDALYDIVSLLKGEEEAEETMQKVIPIVENDIEQTFYTTNLGRSIIVMETFAKNDNYIIINVCYRKNIKEMKFLSDKILESIRISFK